jgi:hypothetical protein
MEGIGREKNNPGSFFPQVDRNQQDAFYIPFGPVRMITYASFPLSSFLGRKSWVTPEEQQYRFFRREFQWKYKGRNVISIQYFTTEKYFRSCLPSSTTFIIKVPRTYQDRSWLIFNNTEP